MVPKGKENKNIEEVEKNDCPLKKKKKSRLQKKNTSTCVNYVNKEMSQTEDTGHTTI